MDKRNRFNPESLMMSYGYKPELSEGALKCPIFQTSTFVFQSAEEGKAFFEVAYGLREQLPNEELGLIYSRLNNPDMEILETRLKLWDDAEDAAVFESGMSAISTVLLEFLKPGDLLLYSMPLYGGTDHFIKHFLPKIGITALGFLPTQTEQDIAQIIESSGKKEALRMIYVETPSNPTNTLIDIQMCKRLAEKYSTGDERVYVAVDNTFLGPIWQHPLKHGADMSIYSATKYISGHSDVIAGAICGSSEVIGRIKTLRTFLGNMAGPWTGWLLMRSLETLKVRMDQQTQNATRIVEVLQSHPKVEKVYYPGLIKPGTRAYDIYKQQCLAPGAMVSFDVKGGEAEAFRFINGLELIKLAVSLGGTESLVEHPFTMTHSGIEHEQLYAMNITEKLIRLSIGIENVEDLIKVITTALDKI